MELSREETKLRAEVAAELEAEESGTAPVVDAHRAAAPEAKPIQEDAWAGVNPALKQMFDEMSQKVSTATGNEERLKQAERRIGSLTNDLAAAKKAADRVSTAPTAEQMAAAAKSDERWEGLKSDFPEWAEAFDGRFDQKLSQKASELRAEISALKELSGVNGEDSNAVHTKIQEAILTFAKPKWRETISSTEWKEWLALQPAEVGALTKSDQAADAVSLIASFEQAKAAPSASEIAAARKQRIKDAVIPQGGKAAPVKSEADLSAAELRANIGREIYSE